VAPSDH
jgi:hypothetical protein